MLNKEQLEGALSELGRLDFRIGREVGYNHIVDKFYWQTSTLNKKNYTLERVESQGGGEGDGEYMDVVFKVTEKKGGEVGYVRFIGTYDSWADGHWHSCEVVEPREVTVTQYFEVESCT